jgi:hypothetical protein
MYKESNLLLVTFDRQHIESDLLHLPHINCQEFDEAFRSPIHPTEHASALLLCVDNSRAEIFRHTSRFRTRNCHAIRNLVKSRN